MILSDRDLNSMFPDLFPDASEEDRALINPASIDIRIGNQLVVEVQDVAGPDWAHGPIVPAWEEVDISARSEQDPYITRPGDFLLASTLERLRVPNGYAVELKLKSSRARQGWNHTLAFWFDPGWDGIGTMEIKNETRHHPLPLWPGLRFGQIIVHRLTSDALKPYQGRYQGARTVEQSKPGAEMLPLTPAEVNARQEG